MSQAEFCELAFGFNQEAKSWLRDEEQVVIQSPFESLLVRTENNIRGCVLFFNRSSNDIEIGFFGKGILSRRVIRFIGTYCFVDNAVNRITARTNATNSVSRETLERCGFKEEGRQRRFFDHHDGIIYGLLKEESKLWDLVK